MLSEKIKFLKFKFACFKLKHSVMKAMKYRLKVLKFCIHHTNKIGIPITKGEIIEMELLLSVYDETISDLNKDMNIYRKYLTS